MHRGRKKGEDEEDAMEAPSERRAAKHHPFQASRFSLLLFAFCFFHPSSLHKSFHFLLIYLSALHLSQLPHLPLSLPLQQCMIEAMHIALMK
jgi:hypothetical protein